MNNHDNDPAHLLASIANALHDVEPIEREVFDSLRVSSPDIADVVLPHLSRTLEGRRLPFVLVLDDAHRLHASESLRALSDLIESVRPGSQIAVASRRDPELPIGRLRAHRMVVELRAPDLAMRADEAAGLLELAGFEPDDDGIAALLRRTEGWPAGLSPGHSPCGTSRTSAGLSSGSAATTGSSSTSCATSCSRNLPRRR